MVTFTEKKIVEKFYLLYSITLRSNIPQNVCAMRTKRASSIFTWSFYITQIVSFEDELSKLVTLTGPPEQGEGGRQRRLQLLPPPPIFSVDVPLFLLSLLNVLFLKDVPKNVDENQQAKSQAS